MSKEVTLDETIEVARPVREVFAYVSEFSRIEEWDPAVERGEKLTPGAPGIGTRYRIDMKAGFSLQYRVVEFEQDRRMLMEVDSKFFTAREEILFADLGGGRTGSGRTGGGRTGGGRTGLRYIATFTFPTPLAMANRVYPAAMDRVGKATMEGLSEALENNFDPPQASRRIELADRLVLPGIWRFTRLGYRVARRHWRPLSAYLGERRAVVTGATSGIGLAAAQALAGLGAQLTLVARDEKKARATAQRIAQETGNDAIDIEICDMSVAGEVHALAERLLDDGRPVHMLVNNAGALFNPRQETAEGYEKSFALLLLGPYILTERLHPLLAGAQDARVVNVSSGGMYTQKIRVDDLQYERGRYSGSTAYARAKRGLVILTEEWARRWRDDGIAVNAMHPGWADTPGVESALPGFHRLTRKVLRSPEEGADTIVWLAAATEAGKVTGEFWLDREIHPTHLSDRTRETPEERERLLQALGGMLEQTKPVKRARPRQARKGATRAKSR